MGSTFRPGHEDAGRIPREVWQAAWDLPHGPQMSGPVAADMRDRLTVQRGIERLNESGELFTTLFCHGSLEIEIYRPQGEDLQEPHTRDEVYVVISGSGFFVNGETRQPFEAGEVLFVPAGAQHRFENFSEDFATWVVFYGPEGGEAATKAGGQD